MSEAGEKFYDLVKRDIQGEATEEESDSLQVDLDTAKEWKAILIRMLQETDAQLTRIGAELQNKNADCARKGWGRSSSDFFLYKAGKDKERAILVKRKAVVVERLAEAKEAVHLMSGGGMPQKWLQDQLNRIEQKLDALLKR